MTRHVAGPQTRMGPRLHWSGVVGVVNTPAHGDDLPALHLPDTRGPKGWRRLPRLLFGGGGRHQPPRRRLPLPLTEFVGDGVERRVGTVTDLWMEDLTILASGTLTLPAADGVDPPWARALRLDLPTSAVVRLSTTEPVPAPPDAAATLRGRRVYTDWQVVGVVVNTVPRWHDCLIHLIEDSCP